MSTYTFEKALLSAIKTGSPPQIDTYLSYQGVTVLTLSTEDVGLLFNSVPVLNQFTSTQLTNFTSPFLSAGALTAVGLAEYGPLSALSPLTATDIFVLGSTFNINTAYAGKQFAVIKTPMVEGKIAPFTHLSYPLLSGKTVGTITETTAALVSATVYDAITPDRARKHMLGYY